MEFCTRQRMVWVSSSPSNRRRVPCYCADNSAVWLAPIGGDTEPEKVPDGGGALHDGCCTQGAH